MLNPYDVSGLDSAAEDCRGYNFQFVDGTSVAARL